MKTMSIHDVIWGLSPTKYICGSRSGMFVWLIHFMFLGIIVNLSFLNVKNPIYRTPLYIIPSSFPFFLMPGHCTYQDIAFSICPIYKEASTNGLKVVFDRVFGNLGQDWNVNTDVFGVQLDIHMYIRLTLPRPCKAGTGSLGHLRQLPLWQHLWKLRSRK